MDTESKWLGPDIDYRLHDIKPLLLPKLAGDEKLRNIFWTILDQDCQLGIQSLMNP